MKAWLANVMWGAVGLLSQRLHDWIFDPQRAARQRMKHRERWWQYLCEASGDKNKLVRARWWQIHFKFETPPDTARKRGDLKPMPPVYPCH